MNVEDPMIIFSLEYGRVFHGKKEDEKMKMSIFEVNVESPTSHCRAAATPSPGTYLSAEVQ